jgi:ribonuclease HI
MDRLFLFTDGSVNTKSKTGYGAYLAVSEPWISTDLLKKQVKIKRFENTSSTRLELETLLWALNEVGGFAGRIIVYTDSQNIMKLKERRERLETNNYRSNQKVILKNSDLYIKFYEMTDILDCHFFKVQGHRAFWKKDETGSLFALVDRESRRALRKSQ